MSEMLARKRVGVGKAIEGILHSGKVRGKSHRGVEDLAAGCI